MTKTPRRGLTLMETVVALAILAIAAGIVAQLGMWAMFERARCEERLAAMECVANILESARAHPWAELTPAWASQQKLPDDLASHLSEPVLSVQVAPEKDQQGLKRITAELQWSHRDGSKARTVSLTGLFADRSRENQK